MGARDGQRERLELVDADGCMSYKLGRIFQKLSRLCFSRVSGVCWNCGTKCGMNSTIARGFMWCNECYSRYSVFIRDKDVEFSLQHFGKPR